MATDMDRMRDAKYANPELDEILKDKPATNSLDASTNIPELRKLLQKRKEALNDLNDPTSKDEITETDIEVEMRDGAKIAVRIHRKPNSKPGPVMVMYHGGGFCLGGLANEALLCRRWCSEYGGVSVNVDYRLAPEHKFPVGVNDAYDALKWAAKNGQSISADFTLGFIVAGISAGANMAAVASHLYRDDGLQPPLTGVYLSIPSLMSPDIVPEKYRHEHTSREENKNAPVLNEAATKLFRAAYDPDIHSPLMSPILFPTGQKGLPPTYFQICGMDPLRDDGLIYEKVLREEHGIKTKVDLYPGLPHGFWSWWPDAQFTKKQQKDSVAGLGWLLENSR